MTFVAIGALRIKVLNGILDQVQMINCFRVVFVWTGLCHLIKVALKDLPQIFT